MANWIDWCIIAVIIVSIIISYRRGLINEIVSIVSWGAAILIAIHFSPQMEYFLRAYLDGSETFRLILGFIFLFLFVLLIGSLLSRLVNDVVKFSSIEFLDHAAGIIFGALRGAILVSLLILAVGLTNDLPRHQVWQESKFIAVFQPLAIKMKNSLPEKFKNKFQFKEADDPELELGPLDEDVDRYYQGVEGLSSS